MLRIDRLKMFKEYGWVYNKETGEIFSHTGKHITSMNKGYIECVIKKEGINYHIKAHQLAYYLTYNEEPDIIDHINGIRNDNRIENLRSITMQQNNFNKKETKGYYFHKKSKLYHAIIQIDNKRISLGYFKTEYEASEAYISAKLIYHII